MHRYTVRLVLAAAWLSACGASLAGRDTSFGVPPVPVASTAARAAALPALAAAPGAIGGCPEYPLDRPGAVVHYVCDCGGGADRDCRPGDDSNEGTSAEKPLRTYSKAQSLFSDFAPGESVAFCRGGSFAGGPDRRWVNTKCRAANPCVVRDYQPKWGSGDEGKPIIRARGGHAFALENGGDAEHEEGFVFLNLELRDAPENFGFFLYNDVDDVLICGVTIDGFAVGVYSAGSNPPAAGSDGRNQRVVLRSSRVVNNGVHGWLGGCDDCRVESNFFDNNGFREAIYNHNVYLDGTSTGMSVVGNELYRSAIVNGECAGVSLVAHGTHRNLLIENNLVREAVGAAGQSCWGIALDTGYPKPEAFRNVTIRGNRVVNVGNRGIGVNACDQCTIENNVVIHDQAFATTAIQAPDRERNPDDAEMTRVTIRNNSVRIGAKSKGGTGIHLGREGIGHVLVSNAVEYLGSDPGFACFEADLAVSAYSFFDNNICHAPNAPGAAWVKGKGDLAAWRAGSRFDAHSAMAEPGFSPPAAPAYDLLPLATGSALVDRGHVEWSAPTAYGGAQRGPKPDIGAHERPSGR